jgi:hypothetical protein
MTEQKKNDVLYVCALIEYVGRATCNHRRVVVERVGIDGLRRQLRYASLNHCLSFEQVGEELIEDHGIEQGRFDTVSDCRYQVPSVTAIGKVYQRLVLAVNGGEPLEETILRVFSSFLSDEISDFNASVFYRSPDYLKYSYLEGQLLPA